MNKWFLLQFTEQPATLHNNCQSALDQPSDSLLGFSLIASHLS